jgi:hypothetical protein
MLGKFLEKQVRQSSTHSLWPGVSSSTGQLSLVILNPLLQQNIILKLH